MIFISFPLDTMRLLGNAEPNSFIILFSTPRKSIRDIFSRCIDFSTNSFIIFNYLL
ncbi:hypothetical protein MYP_1464 [Sporocytophaga myxococcoides]|uniref:Uncharacterized protein n=1 Tax=Sporocytophaga myxococcoides TaxID=153721 RepID=A0A098LBH2_9BACT|nr:hypothetical protein MYP_1464 [Sporocytophaga myxococcoides]